MRILPMIIAIAFSLCGLLGVFIGRVAADAVHVVDRAASSGLGVGAGLGTESVFLGGHVRYYLQLRQPRLRVIMHVGAGVLPMEWNGVPLWGMTGGAFLGYGKRNRLVAGLIGGTLDWTTYSPYGETLAARQIVGVGVSGGWELMTRGGFFVRGGLGPAAAVQREVPLQERKTYMWFVFSISIGYKLW